jgi:hypothetical protein
MEKSAESLVYLTDYRIKLGEQKATKEADSMPMKLAPTLQHLYRHVTQHCADQVVKNWQQRLTVYRAATDKFCQGESAQSTSKEATAKQPQEAPTVHQTKI